MRLGIIPEGAAEREALESAKVPVPFFETRMAFGLARAVMAATKLGVFESLTAGPATQPRLPPNAAPTRRRPRSC
jgi:acetyl-CoA carboxylase carboxyltransferase component